MFNVDLEPQRALHSPMLASALGVLVGLRFAPGKTLWERLVNVFSGLLLAAYTAPALLEWLAVSSAGISAAVAFLIGLFGLSLAAAVSDGIRNLRMDEIFSSWMKRKE